MMIPSMVRADRILLRAMARIPTLRMFQKRCIASPDYSWTPGRNSDRRLKAKVDLTPACPRAGQIMSATEIFRRGKEVRRRRCRSASARSADDSSAEKIGAAAGVVHE